MITETRAPPFRTPFSGATRGCMPFPPLTLIRHSWTGPRGAHGATTANVVRGPDGRRRSMPAAGHDPDGGRRERADRQPARARLDRAAARRGRAVKDFEKCGRLAMAAMAQCPFPREGWPIFPKGRG